MRPRSETSWPFCRGPLADRRRVAGRRRRPARLAAAPALAAAAAAAASPNRSCARGRPTARTTSRSSRGVVRREVDLVGDAVQGERHRLLCGPAVDVVDQEDLDLLRHVHSLRHSRCRCSPGVPDYGTTECARQRVRNAGVDNSCTARPARGRFVARGTPSPACHDVESVRRMRVHESGRRGRVIPPSAPDCDVPHRARRRRRGRTVRPSPATRRRIGGRGGARDGPRRSASGRSGGVGLAARLLLGVHARERGALGAVGIDQRADRRA